MKRIVVLMLMLAAGVANAQPQHMQPDMISRSDGPPEVLLLTFGEGVQIFEKFGHAALCLHYPGVKAPLRAARRKEIPALQDIVRDLSSKLGIPPDEVPAVSCVNYGVTNFREGAIMIWHFLRTEQKFWADTESMVSMVQFYSGRDDLGQQLEEDRDIWIQKLPLDDKGERIVEGKLFGSLVDEEGRNCEEPRLSKQCYYYYDHFFDNCTTRLRDFIDEASSGKLSAESKTVDYPLTFRQMGRRGLAELPPLIVLADYVLGRQLDDTPSLWEAMFHPDVLREQVKLKLGVEPVMIYKRKGPDFPQDGSTGRIPMFGIALLFALPLLLAYWKRKAQGLALVWATLFLGLMGLIIYVLVAISSIPGVRWNEAVFVMMPFDFALPFLKKKRVTYARIRVAMLLAVSLFDVVGLFHQPLMIPILSAIMPLSIIAFDLPHPILKLIRERSGSSGAAHAS